jgi:hypothetical protein
MLRVKISSGTLLLECSVLSVPISLALEAGSDNDNSHIVEQFEQASALPWQLSSSDMSDISTALLLSSKSVVGEASDAMYGL